MQNFTSNNSVYTCSYANWPWSRRRGSDWVATHSSTRHFWQVCIRGPKPASCAKRASCINSEFMVMAFIDYRRVMINNGLRMQDVFLCAAYITEDNAQAGLY